MDIQKSDLQKIYDVLLEAEQFHVHRDKMNARLHLAKETRYSPLTSNLISERERLAFIIGQLEG